MKILSTAFLLVSIMLTNIAMGCTTFFLQKNGQMAFGRNYDWVTGTGMIYTNLRGLAKRSFDPAGGAAVDWVSKYGSVTFNQYGKEFPNGGMNEKGLVVELMWLNESKYPAPDKRPGISVLQWIQYQLDHCSSVDEVLATDKQVRIVSTGTPQHYLVADQKGRVATIEFLNGKMVVHKGKSLPYPVLANSTYESSMRSLKTTSTNSDGLGFQANSGDRFTRACQMVQQYTTTDSKKPIVDYSFDILNSVSQGSFTKWSIVYDIRNRQIHFKTFGYSQLKSLDVTTLNFACNSAPLALNMNQSLKGNIKKEFEKYSNERNKQMLKQAFKESRSEINIAEPLQDAAAEVAQRVTCK